MKLFARKARKTVAEFNRDFYDRFVFNACVIAPTPVCDPTGGEAARLVADMVRREVGKADAYFLTAPLPTLVDELLALRLEIVGMAWADNLSEELAIASSKFTHDYLAEIGRPDLWKTMHDYNQAIAYSLVETGDPRSEEASRLRMKSNQYRVERFERLMAQGHDPHIMGRVVNRSMGLPRNLFTSTAYLGQQLVRRVGFQCTKPIWVPMGYTLSGLYEGALGKLDEVKLTA